MFVPSTIHHRDCPNGCTPYVADAFGLVCWNVHKQNHIDERLSLYLRERFASQADFLLLQEVGFAREHQCALEGYAFEAAANMERDDTYYGVLTASRSMAVEARAFLSHEREGIWGTHKSLVLGRYLFGDGTPMLVANVHAINFRENHAYRQENERLFTYLAGHRGPMILAGDFNAWNATRTRDLLRRADRLNLAHVPVDQWVKSFRGYPLDYVFYRGVELREYAVDDAHAVSDHHPIFARFERG